MNLPNAHLAIVEREKITDYLLNAVHPENAGKARFFLDLGFTPKEWRTMADAFRELAENATSVRRVESPHGEKFVVEGELVSPIGDRSLVRSIWIIEHGEMVPRLVTAYPA